MYCLEFVASVRPCSGSNGLIVFSSVQLKRPNHWELALWLKSIRSVTWFLSTVLSCAIWRLLLGFALFCGLILAWGRNASSACDVGSSRSLGIMLPENGWAVHWLFDPSTRVAGSISTVLSCEKSPLRQASGRTVKLPVFWRRLLKPSQFELKKSLFRPLNNLGIQTGPPR